jgi:7-carboxy-7-deazaguanine synthase
MAYSVKEIYYTLQGEGTNTGRPAVFCRFAGCNLWNGKEEDRARAVCNFCDTDFVGIDGPGGGAFRTASDLARAVKGHWPSNGSSHSRPLIVCTGGEPLLQLDDPLVEELHLAGFEIAIETNGTIVPPSGIDWICVSPKSGAELVLKSGDELKLVYPQRGIEPEDFVNLDFGNFFLQPMDSPQKEENTRLAIEYCLKHPQWRLSLQTHKYLGMR